MLPCAWLHWATHVPGYVHLNVRVAAHLTCTPLQCILQMPVNFAGVEYLLSLNFWDLWNAVAKDISMHYPQIHYNKSREWTWQNSQ